GQCGVCAVDVVEHLLRPCAARRAQLEDTSMSISSTADGCDAKQIARAIHDQTILRVGAIRGVSKTVEDSFRPGAAGVAEFEHNAVSKLAATKGRTIEVAVGVEYHV